MEFFVSVGIGLLVLFLILIIIFFLVSLTRKPRGKRGGREEEEKEKQSSSADHRSGWKFGFSWWLARAFALVFVGLIIGALIYYHPWTLFFKSSTATQTAAVTTPECPGYPIPLWKLNLSQDRWTPLTRACRFVYDIPSRNVDLSDGRNVASAEDWIEFVPIQARATTSEPVEGYYSLCPLNTGTRPINWDCSFQ